MSTQTIKHKLATVILDNGTYRPDSILWCRLYNRLMTLPKDELESLKLFIDLKVNAAIEAKMTSN